MRASSLLLSLALVCLGSGFAGAQTLFTDRATFQSAAGGAGDIFDDCNTGGTDRGTHLYSGTLFAFPNGNPTTDIDGTGYLRTGLEPGGLLTISFDAPIIAIGFDVNPWCNGGDCNFTNSLGSTINFTTTGTLPQSGSYTLPVVYGPEFRGIVFGAGSSITSISLATSSLNGWHGLDNIEIVTDPNFLPENCSDGIDNDLDSLIDCADPDCAADVACPEDCSNGVDDDSDGLVDCDDAECDVDLACLENCANGIDDDANGLIDCEDPDCFGDLACLEDCANGVDDNANGLIDCADPDCSNEPSCLPPGDTCGAPLMAIEGSQPFDTSLLTSSPEPSDPLQCSLLGAFDQDIWFEYTAPSDGILDASICGTASFDSDFAVYLGDCASLVQVGCAGDTVGCAGFTGEVLRINATAGEVYLIRIGGWSGGSGPGSLQVTFTPTGPTFVRGDTNLDGMVDIADAVASLAFLFTGEIGRASCRERV